MNQIKIEIPTPLRPYTENNKRVEILANNVDNALTTLVSTFPKLKPQLFDNDVLRSYVNIYLNDEDVRFLDEKYHTELKGGDILSIIPSIAGGSS